MQTGFGFFFLFLQRRQSSRVLREYYWIVKVFYEIKNDSDVFCLAMNVYVCLEEREFSHQYSGKVEMKL